MEKEIQEYIEYIFFEKQKRIPTELLIILIIALTYAIIKHIKLLIISKIHK